MLTIQFLSVVAGQGHTIGPMPRFQIDGPELRAGTSGNVLANHEGHQWKFQNSWYIILRVNSPVRLHFGSDGQNDVGPFPGIEMRDGHLYTSDGTRIAHFDDKKGTWRTTGNQDYRFLVVEVAA